MDTLFDYVTSDVRWKEALEEAEKKEGKSQPRGDKYDNDDQYNYAKE